MTELEILNQISEQLTTLLNVALSLLAGVSFVAANLFWRMVREMMRERDF